MTVDRAIFDKLKELANEGGVTLEERFDYHWANTTEYFAWRVEPPLPEWKNDPLFKPNAAVGRGVIRLQGNLPHIWWNLGDVAQIQAGNAPHRLILSWRKLDAIGYIRVPYTSGVKSGWHISQRHTPYWIEMTTTIRDGKQYVKFLT
ncbi:hypothetical protein PV10_01613 [Exophiala mesophila]|uniref:Uncharacterized protein n=1 Tax=Exophiala mesophila TaxID=212818 RepID=A0A0D1ZTL6_EXOME|nr:uncharacterized protein PV10_01613 [Exophiala mesophila]KIV97912.1 hypothetical protein PV10_01613 [Exophiala mesophila]